MNDHLYIAYLPDPGVEPRATFLPQDDPIPAIYLSRTFDSTSLRIQFDAKDPGDAIRYLRQLAAVATDLADQVQDHAAGAVLGG